jgi:hypothetical protein
MSGVIDQGRWGICGFVSVLNALHEQGKLKEFGKDLPLNDIQQRLGAELITYLKMTKVERPAIASAILAFTQSFGPPYSGYKGIDDICTRIATEMTKTRPPGEMYYNQGGMGIALPPQAVQDYVRFAGLKANPTLVGTLPFTKDELLKHKDCIIACGRDPKTDQYSGLRHWIYVNPQGCLVNWGTSTDLTKDSLPAMNFGYIPFVVQLL